MNDLNCFHNQRTRFEHGFHCEDCNTFFGLESPEYRSDELLNNLWCVLNNIGVEERAARRDDTIVTQMQDKIGIGVEHTNYEDIIDEAEKIIKLYGKNNESASITI